MPSESLPLLLLLIGTIFAEFNAARISGFLARKLIFPHSLRFLVCRRKCTDNRQRGLQKHRPTVRHISGLGRAGGLQWRLNYLYRKYKVYILENASVYSSGGEMSGTETKKLTSSEDASVPANVSDWIVTPVPLNDKQCGKRAIFSKGNSIVERKNPGEKWDGCVCYTKIPLPLRQVWQISVLETTEKWPWGLVSICERAEASII